MPYKRFSLLMTEKHITLLISLLIISYLLFLTIVSFKLRILNFSIQDYRPRMTTLGSREQLCIHDEVRLLRGRAQNNACRYLCKKRMCTHQVGVSGKSFVIVKSFHPQIIVLFRIGITSHVHFLAEVRGGPICSTLYPLL